jgi:hypothetical protein
LVLTIMLGLSANAATLNGATVNNAWNTTISWNDTLFEWTSNTKAWESTTIINDDCKKFPEKCARTSSSNDNNAETVNKSMIWNNSKSNLEEIELTKLPQTWATENVLILSSIVMASIIFFKRRKKQ